MAYPFLTHPEAALRLDEAGRGGGASCLGTGINPGFVLDHLPSLLAGAVDRVERLRASRVVDASRRRGPLQRKVGAGLTREEFAARVAAGGFGHRGMLESLHLLCAALGADPRGAETFIEPVIAESEVRTEFVTVAAGRVAGIHQGARTPDGRVSLELEMYVGARAPRDTVEIDGDPPLRAVIEGGYQGDVATCAVVINAVRPMCTAAPGLRTMLDVHAPRGWMG
jgi:4-hydroxy-tetrahydrodipicolinate reductase